ncbi:MAG: calcium/sodium antiporter [Parvibaculales bacterium]|jgi:cation:H+ antiporter|tara:strand:- start:1190 stop:2137 length:948 start_codon:yes stop_codon:yes gene_type:complete
MDIPFLYCVAGFILLGVSGEALLRGAVTTADRLKVPPLLIGLTVIAFGTSIPELTVSLNAARSGNPDIAVGNVVGSNIANILLVLGAMAVFRSFTIDAGTLNRDGRVMLGVSVLMVLMALNGVITQWMGFGLLAILAGFTFLLYRRARQEADVDETAASVDENLLEGSLFLALLILIAGLAGVLWGSDLMVKGAVGVAQQAGISQAVIALSIVAIGTSLPELFISLFASLRGHASLAIGNIIGSNISNILLILGVVASTGPLNVSAEIANRDVWVMLGVAILGLVLMRSARRMSRIEGLFSLVLYALYVGYLYFS